jgi:Concanavalin A-like lectin/glucanases superfamily
MECFTMTTPFLVALKAYVQEVAVGATTSQQDATFLSALQAYVLDTAATLIDPVPLDSGLTAYFPFESDLNFTANIETDEFGNVGTLKNMTAANQVAGQIGQALKTSGQAGGAPLGPGVGEIIVFPATFLDHTTDSFSVNFWLNASSQVGQWWCCPVAKSAGGPGSSGWFFIIDNSQDLISFNISDGVNSAGAGVTKSVNNNTWHMVTGVVDRVAKNLSFYVDGVLIGSGSTASVGSISAPTVPFVIGARPYPGSYCYFNGIIDDVRHYGRVLSQADVLLLFDLGSASEAP